MEIVRFVSPSDNHVSVGGIEDGIVYESRFTSMSELLRLSLADFRSEFASLSGRTWALDKIRPLAPVDGMTEVWAAGVTYETSRTERIAESPNVSGIYNEAYSADRPELFFKATSWRVVGDGDAIGIRRDSEVNVPEPELGLVMNSRGEIVGYTVCNDVSSRSIESDNPLYLPQAKIYTASCAVGRGITPVWEVGSPYCLGMSLEIRRSCSVVWSGAANTKQLHRKFDELISHLRYANVFPDGAILATGTSLVPPLPFTLMEGDVVSIVIEGVGKLETSVSLVGGQTS